MKYLCIAFMGLLIMSCGTSPEEKAEKQKKEDIEKIKANTLAFIKSLTNEDPEGTIIDSIKVVRIDTLNEKLDSTLSMNAYMSKIKRISEYRKLLNSEFENRSSFAEISAKLGMDHSTWTNDAKSKLEKSKKLGAYGLKLLDHVGNIDSLIKVNAYDSSKPTGYIAIVNAYAHNKAMVSRSLDSMNIPLNLDFMINDKVKKIHDIDFDKF